MEHLTRFVNLTFGRKLGGSRSLYDAIRAAKAAGYSDKEMRIALWVARCNEDQEAYITKALSAHGMPELALRFQGGQNPWGQPARRWLDELVAQAREMNVAMVKAVLQKLPEEMRGPETELLREMVGDPVQ